MFNTKKEDGCGKHATRNWWSFGWILTTDICFIFLTGQREAKCPPDSLYDMIMWPKHIKLFFWTNRHLECAFIEWSGRENFELIYPLVIVWALQRYILPRKPNSRLILSLIHSATRDVWREQRGIGRATRTWMMRGNREGRPLRMTWSLMDLVSGNLWENGGCT